MSDFGSSSPPPPHEPPGSTQPSEGQDARAPENYLVWAILSTVLCLPLGIASVVFAAQVNGRWAMGDAAGAQKASSRAKGFAIWAAIIGAVLWGIVFLLGLLLHGLTKLTVS